MKIIDIDPLVDEKWLQLLQAYKSDVFHSPAWMKGIADTYGFEFQARVLLDDEGQPLAGIPYCRIEDMMDTRLVSIPFSDYCDALVSTAEQWDQLVQPLLQENCQISVRCLHNEIPLQDANFPQVNRAKWHSVDLKISDDERWESVHSSGRRAVRKAIKSGTTVRIANDKDALRTFFEMHLNTRKYKYQMVAQPYAFFENIWKNFVDTGNGALFVAEHSGQIVAGVLFLFWQKRLYYKFNASHPDFMQFRPNDLIAWEALKYGHQQGFEYLDFGLSDWDQDSLVRYKQKYATEEKTISFLRYTPAHLPSEKTSRMRKLMPQLTDLFVAEGVPDEITEKAGSILYRYFL